MRGKSIRRLLCKLRCEPYMRCLLKSSSRTGRKNCIRKVFLQGEFTVFVKDSLSQVPDPVGVARCENVNINTARPNWISSIKRG